MFIFMDGTPANVRLGPTQARRGLFLRSAERIAGLDRAGLHSCRARRSISNPDVGLQHLDPFVEEEHEVLHLEVSVRKALAMEEAHAVQDAFEHRPCLRLRNAPHFLHVLSQRKVQEFKNDRDVPLMERRRERSSQVDTKI